MASGAPSQQAQHRDAWLWCNDDLADISLRLYSASTDGSDMDACPLTAAPITTLQLHSVVLAGASPGYFRRHILRLFSKDSAQASGSPQGTTYDVTMASGPDTPSKATGSTSAMDSMPASQTGTPSKAHGASRSAGSSAAHAMAVAGGAVPTATVTLASSGNSTPSSKRPRESSSGGNSSNPAALVSTRALHLTLHPGEPHTVPEAVLCHVYTGTLPDDPELLVWMLWRADYLDLAATVEACMGKLLSQASHKQLSLQHVGLLGMLPPLQTGHSQAIDAQVQELVGDVLSIQLPVAHELLANTAQLDLFTQLPLSLVKRWASMPALQIDSGNTLAVLFTAWYDAQPTPPTEEQCQELSALLPLSAVSISFHLQALPHLKWWRPPKGLPPNTGVMHMLALLHSSNNTLQQWWGEKTSAQVTLGQPVKAAHTWHVDHTQIKQLWKDKDLLLHGYTYGGFHFQPRLTLEPSTRNVGHSTLRLRCDLAWPDALLKHGLGSVCSRPAVGLHFDAQADWESGTAAVVGQTVQLEGSCWESGWGWSDIFTNDWLQVQDMAPTLTSALILVMTCRSVQ